MMIHKALAVAVVGFGSILGLQESAFGAAAAAAGGASAGGGGHASGGVVSTGGGGGSGGGTHASGGGVVGGAGGTSPLQHGVINTPTPSAGSGSPSGTPANSGGTTNGQGHHDRNRGYPYGVAYPYSPFGFGYGGDYNNGYGNNGVVNTNNSQASFDNSTSGTVTTDNGNSVTTPQVTPADPNAAAAAAKMQNAADHSPQVLTLQAEVHRDQQDYDAARERVLAQLRQQPDYQKAVQERRNAGAQVRSTKLTAPANTNAVVSAAESKLEAGDAVTKMEQYAVDQDPAAAAAKAKLADAMTKLTAMRGSAGVK